MSRHNITILYGVILKDPIIQKDADGNALYGLCYINVVRSLREVGDGLKTVQTAHPPIMTREPAILAVMEQLKAHDMVLIKGSIASKSIKKSSFCKNEACHTKVSVDGTLVYVNPIYMEKIKHCETNEEILNDLLAHREISNIVYVLGTLCRDPKKIRPSNGMIVTQYQIALNRKFRIRTDPPEIKADYPWVKSYGENAKEDKARLHTGSIVFIDGFLQARNVQRHAVCPVCNQKYDWIDNAMEIVPYETEYMPGTFYSDEDIAEMNKKQSAQARNDIFGDDDSEDVIED